jgi:hypothetical protein
MFATLVALAASAAEVPSPPVQPPSTVAQALAAPALPVGTPVRLMVVREVSGRTAQPGDRFKLRVDEAVSVEGTPVVPVGATAWGEVTSVKANGAVGKSGRLGAKLLHVDLPSGRIPLRGEPADSGKGNTTGVVLAVIGFGVLGLLNGGDSARLKAGDIFTGYVDAGVAPEVK